MKIKLCKWFRYFYEGESITCLHFYISYKGYDSFYFPISQRDIFLLTLSMQLIIIIYLLAFLICYSPNLFILFSSLTNTNTISEIIICRFSLALKII